MPGGATPNPDNIETDHPGGGDNSELIVNLDADPAENLEMPDEFGDLTFNTDSSPDPPVLPDEDLHLLKVSDDRSSLHENPEEMNLGDDSNPLDLTGDDGLVLLDDGFDSLTSADETQILAEKPDEFRLRLDEPELLNLDDDELHLDADPDPLILSDEDELRLEADPDALILSDNEEPRLVDSRSDSLVLADEEEINLDGPLELPELEEETPVLNDPEAGKSPSKKAGLIGNIRRDAQMLLQGIQGDLEIVEELRKLLGGKRVDIVEAQAVRGCDSIALVGKELSWGDTKTVAEFSDSLRTQAELCGLVYAFDRLAERDSALVEQCVDLIKNRKGDPEDAFERIAQIYRDSKSGDFAPLYTLIKREYEGGNDLSMTHLTRGALMPYFAVSNRSPQGGVSHFFQAFLSDDVPKSIQDLWSNGDYFPRDGRFLRELANLADPPTAVPVALVAPATPVAPPEKRKGASELADSKLVEIVTCISQPEDLLGALEVFVNEANEISIADLHLITKHLPRGVRWGTEQVLSDGFPGWFSGGYDKVFVPTDLKILRTAISKLSDPTGKEFAGRVGKQLRTIISDSKIMRWTSAANGSDKKTIRNKLLDGFGSQLGQILGADQE